MITEMYHEYVLGISSLGRFILDCVVDARTGWRDLSFVFEYMALLSLLFLFSLPLPLLSSLPSLVSLRDFRRVGLLALLVPQVMTPDAYESSRVFGSSNCPASFPACDVLILTAAVMSPAIGISRLILCLVPFALLTVASGCYHMSLAFFTTTWELRGWTSLCERLGLSF